MKKNAVLLLLSMLMLACTKPKTSVATKGNIKDIYNEKNEAKFIEGMGFFNSERYDEALDKFQQCYEVQPEEAGLSYMIARTYLEQKSYEKAIKYIDKALELDPTQKDYYLISAECYKKVNKLEEVVKIYERMMKSTKSAEPYLYDLYEAQMYVRKYAEALKTIDHIQSIFGSTEALINEKLKLYLRLGRAQDAEKDLKAIIAENPQDIKYRHSLIKLYMENKQLVEAEQSLDALLKDHPSDPIGTMLKYDLFKQRGQRQQAEEFLDKIFSNPQINIDTKIDFVLAMFKGIEGNPDKQVKLINYTDEIVKTNPDNAKAYALAGDVNSFSDKKASAIANYRKAVKLDASKNLVWVQLVLLELQENQLDSVILHAKTAQELFPLDSRFPYFAGTAYYQQKNYTAAVKYLKQAQALLTSDSDVKDNTRSVLADCYHYLKEYEKSDQIFEELIKENPNNYSAMNNYCYFLSLRKEKLNYAKELGLKVVKAHPEEATYLDTYGWVLYVNKEYKDAEVYLRKAIQNTNNGTILEHYGDVLFQLGEIDKALDYWQKAKTAGDASEFINKKIKDKKLYE